MSELARDGYYENQSEDVPGCFFFGLAFTCSSSSSPCVSSSSSSSCVPSSSVSWSGTYSSSSSDDSTTGSLRFFAAIIVNFSFLSTLSECRRGAFFGLRKRSTSSESESESVVIRRFLGEAGKGRLYGLLDGESSMSIESEVIRRFWGEGGKGTFRGLFGGESSASMSIADLLAEAQGALPVDCRATVGDVEGGGAAFVFFGVLRCSASSSAVGVLEEPAFRFKDETISEGGLLFQNRYVLQSDLCFYLVEVVICMELSELERYWLCPPHL